MCWGRASCALPRGSSAANAGRGDPAHHRGAPHHPDSPAAKKAVAHLACAPSLRLPWAIGRVRLTQGEALYALGVELPFWLAECIHWRRGVLLLWRSDALRVCCAPWRLRLPDVGAAVHVALARLERTVSVLTTTCLFRKFAASSLRA
jgi:hypothetical protein